MANAQQSASIANCTATTQISTLDFSQIQFQYLNSYKNYLKIMCMSVCACTLWFWCYWRPEDSVVSRSWT